MDARVWLVVGVVAGVSAFQVSTSANAQEVDIPPVVVTQVQPVRLNQQPIEPVKRRTVPASQRLSVEVITQPTLQSLSDPAIRIVKSPTLRTAPEPQAEPVAGPSFRSLMQPAPQRATDQTASDDSAEPAVQPAQQPETQPHFPTIRRRIIPAKWKLTTEPKPERSAQRSARRSNRTNPANPDTADQPAADPVTESNAPVVFTTAAFRL